ncbi:chemotaxis protein CheX [Allobacillus sp. GCM10007491]|uniref:Chemotaxis protein CheX n=1 Tax=Allobacillus saliphilus TaxID=2912308 RepID=A0A941HUC4_9BACI|nr:chemotaxis protein CheX [Allobacillus saliphilus]MBR7554740.1 chemotaxis protein CheX [Allobacillus saliphilus]MBR7554933.1 chemotaxis protein CheX [Allobacillus saliphilus]
MGRPSADTKELHTQFGVLIGITGHVKGQLLFSGDQNAFGVIGTSMFGMELSGDMLNSFCGEFGNMVAGGLATIVSEQSVTIDITSPTLVEGDMRMTGFKRSIAIPFTIEAGNELTIYLLLDQ